MSHTSQMLSEILGDGPVRVHLIGVAGSGMSGIAGLLLALGHEVSGSDRVSTIEIGRLVRLGLKFYPRQEASQVRGADLVIYSSAIRPGNPEFDEARRLGIHSVLRADALAAIMHYRKGIIVAGMHGKTTTSAMTAHVLRAGGLKPSHYVGAEIPILGTNAHWEAGGEWFVAEGDESDGTLVNYHPEHTLILNIEEEHLDFYRDLTAIETVFSRLLDQTRGTVFYCADDFHTNRICSVREDAVSFGESPDADYRFESFRTEGLRSYFDVYHRREFLGRITLNVPGRHNASNAMGVIALASEFGVPFEKIAHGLATFSGARRRFEVKYKSEDYTVIDDYAHHPSEIKATLATARQLDPKRLLILFQPHRYTRTVALRDEFGTAFDAADLVFITSIYPASEPLIPGVSGQTIVDAMVEHGHEGARYLPERGEMLQAVGHSLQPGDVVMTLGAGNVHELGTVLARDLASLEALRAEMGEGVLRLYEPLAKHTTLRVGGPAQIWAGPETAAGFARLVAWCHLSEMPLTVMGRGSNLLVRDAGIRGVVVHFGKGELREIQSDGYRITAGAGVRFKEVAMHAKARGIGGLEWMEGIPGTVGGGLRMNAGAMGDETFSFVRCLKVVDQAGNIHERTPQELEIHYRNVPDLKLQYVIEATFEGIERDPAEIAERLERSMEKRRTTQPRESSAGCIFKNPSVCPAGKLVDELGLKGSRVGGARVSSIHGNFIINDGTATAADVQALIARIRAEALERRGITLETEVQIVGETESFLLP